MAHSFIFTSVVTVIVEVTLFTTLFKLDKSAAVHSFVGSCSVFNLETSVSFESGWVGEGRERSAVF